MKKRPAEISYHQFIDQYFSLKQTGFVEELLRNDTQANYLNHLKNIGWYHARLSTGNFSGPENEYYSLLEALYLKKRSQPTKTKKKVVQKDIILLEHCNRKERRVLDWYAIPYWVAQYMTEKGQVALQHPSACWWGKTDTGILSSNQTIHELFRFISEYQSNIWSAHISNNGNGPTD